MTDFTLQRINMVESQVRPSDVTDQRIIRAMLDVPRERFVPADVVAIAYIDGPVPATTRPLSGAGRGGPRCLLPPRSLAKMVQLAEIEPQSTVLDVGCATGYASAVLARLAARVVALESDHDLARTAAANLEELGIGNTKVVEGPLAAGAPGEGRFDAILINGAVAAVPPSLLEQLADGGRLVALVRKGPVCRAHIWRRSGKVIDGHASFEAAGAPLPGFEEPAAFVL